MITSSNSFENYYGGGGYDDDYDDNFRSSTPPPDHSKHTYMTGEERAEIHSLGEPSAQPSSSSSSDV